MGDRSVTAIVVNYNSGSHLQTCLEALLADDRHLSEIAVVDNASSDASWVFAEQAAQANQRVRLVRSSHNLGLAAGVNLVLGSATTEYVAVLNPDVAPMPGWLNALTDLMDEDPTVSVTCPLVLTPEGRVNSAGQHVHVTGLGFNRHLGSPPDDVEDHPVDVGGLHGAAFMIRTEALEDIGGWDSTGFLYQEDVALSWDILLSGRRLVFVPDSKVVHDYHLTMYPEKFYLLERNRWALLLSHLRVSRLVALSIPILVSELLVWGLAAIRGPRFIAAKARAIRWVFTEWSKIRDWRSRVFSRPVYDVKNLRKGVRWGYPMSQLLGLGAERGESTRIPPGGLPV